VSEDKEAAEAVALSEVIGLIWNRVVQTVNKLVDAHKQFEFVHFAENLNPSLEDLNRAFEVVDVTLSILMKAGLGLDEERTAINAQQCILKMKLLAVACAKNDKDDYEKIIHDLKNQAP